MATKPAGFLGGFTALLTAVGWLLKRPAKLPYALVPVLVVMVLEVLALAFGVWLVRPWTTELIGETHTALGSWSRAAAGWASVGAVAVLGWLLAVPLAPALSAPALERLVDAVERDLGVPARAPIGWLSEVSCGFRAMAAALVFGLPVLMVLWALGWLVPVLLPVATALELLAGAWIVAWGLFDYPLTLRGVGVRQRLGLLRRHPAPVLGFGMACTLAFGLACCGILLLPVGVVAATRLLLMMLEQHPEDLPALPRRGISR